MAPPHDPLVPSAPREKRGGYAGCLLGLGGFVGAFIALMGVFSVTGPTEFALGIGLPAVFVTSAYLFFLPSATRRRWIRRSRLTRLMRRRRLADGRFTPGTLSLPLSAFAVGEGSGPPDAPEAHRVRQAIAEARHDWGLHLQDPADRLVLHLTALSVKVPEQEALFDELAPIGRWLAGALDPMAAWCVALVSGEQREPAVVREALGRLVERAPAAPVTGRVSERALAHPEPRFRLAAALATQHGPTLTALSNRADIDAFDGPEVRALVGARIALGDDAALLAHPHAAVRLAWLLETAEPDASALVALAGDPLELTRAIAWAKAERLAADALLPAARRVVQAADAPLDHPLVSQVGKTSFEVRGLLMPGVLAHLGAFGEPDDLRHVAALMEHPEHRRAARRARAQMHVRLADRITTGQLSLPSAQARGQLSMDPDADGGLSLPADTVE